MLLLALAWTSASLADTREGRLPDPPDRKPSPAPADVSRLIAHPVTDARQIMVPDKTYAIGLIAQIPDRAFCALALGDIDNDGKPELVSGTSIDGALRIHEYHEETRQFTTKLLHEKLGGPRCPEGNVSNVLITDLNGDGTNEIVAMTDQEQLDSNMKLWVFSNTGKGWFKNSIEVKSASYWTHGLAAFDADGDGIQEVFSAHCGHGEIFRYAFSSDLRQIRYKMDRQLWAPGEGLDIADVFGSGKKRLIVVQGDDRYNTAVKIYGITKAGLRKWPDVCIDNYKGRKFCDAATCTQDVDNDGKNELVVAWCFPRPPGELTLLVYKFGPTGDLLKERALTEFSREFGAAPVEATMSIGKLGTDEKNKLYISRGDKGIYRCDVASDLSCRFKRILTPVFQEVPAGRLCLGDADNDGKCELVFTATYKEPYVPRVPRRSFIFMLKPK